MKEEQKIVLVDCHDQDIKGKEVSFHHASNIFKIQKAQKRNDWTLSEGQNYQLNDGVLTERSDSEDSSGRSKAKGTRKLPEA